MFYSWSTVEYLFDFSFETCYGYIKDDCRRERSLLLLEKTFKQRGRSGITLFHTNQFPDKSYWNCYFTRRGSNLSQTVLRKYFATIFISSSLTQIELLSTWFSLFYKFNYRWEFYRSDEAVIVCGDYSYSVAIERLSYFGGMKKKTLWKLVKNYLMYVWWNYGRMY